MWSHEPGANAALSDKDRRKYIEWLDYNVNRKSLISSFLAHMLLLPVSLSYCIRLREAEWSDNGEGELDAFLLDS